MTARAAVYALLSEDPVLESLGVERVYPSGSLDSPPEQTFLIIRQETDEAPAYAQRVVSHATIWAHTRDGDYGPIDSILHRVRDLLENAVHLLGADGWTLTQADWRGDSADLVDGGFHTLTRNSDFAIVSRRAVP